MDLEWGMRQFDAYSYPNAYPDANSNTYSDSNCNPNAYAYSDGIAYPDAQRRHDSSYAGDSPG